MSFAFVYMFAAAASLLVLSNLAFVILRNIKAQFALSQIFMLLLIASLFWAIGAGANFTVLNLLSFNVFSLYFALILTIGVLLTNVLGYTKDIHFSNFSLLSSFALVGIYLVAMAHSIVSIFIGIELLSMPTIFAILLSRKVAIEAAVKLFILASISIALFAFGMVLVYGATGSSVLSNSNVLSSLMLIALGLIVAALGFDAALFPFNLWVPDVYQGATSYVTALLGGINKKIGFIALLEMLFFVFFSYRPYFVPILYALAVLTMFYGNLAALAQRNVKRLLAYSSIAQAGYIAIGLAVATIYSLQAASFQIFAHMLMFIGAMSVIVFMEGRNRHEISDYIGLYKENSLAAACFAITLLSLVGTPLTMGFIGKFMLFSSAVYAKMLPLALAGIINSIISVYYYIKVIGAMYTDRVGAKHAKISTNVMVVMVACTALLIVFGIFPNIVIDYASSIGNYLLPTTS
ncbi:MAG: NADH-quinone oxidoreductase subunit N [Candidatus Micrarchaeota archaeon]|nr:NADH-quinone oxidoreductase subunit N [Candidatus Micrarchaeota archaeon]MDE1804646.1 NADH-quinone oxidoreductase subunit N [Candidatus Micrarchaeota archaeon]MDE1847032.1 NADH-quinone oxidoreductase subunit N [Candidatus Micrarchaeota archaeon]